MMDLTGIYEPKQLPCSQPLPIPQHLLNAMNCAIWCRSLNQFDCHSHTNTSSSYSNRDRSNLPLNYQKICKSYKSTNLKSVIYIHYIYYMHLVSIMSSKMSTCNVKPDCVNFFFTLPQLLFLIILETFSLIVLSLSEGDQMTDNEM